jgi:hypothetical protein
VAELHPDADVTDGGWLNEVAGTSLFASIDEATINDSDYIRSQAMPLSDVCEVALENPLGTPGQPMTVSYRYKDGGVTGDISLIVTLLQGATEIATWSHNNISGTFSTVQQTLSSGEFAAISDFTDLRLRFEATYLSLVDDTFFVVQRDGTYVTERDLTQVVDQRP